MSNNERLVETLVEKNFFDLLNPIDDFLIKNQKAENNILFYLMDSTIDFFTKNQKVFFIAGISLLGLAMIQEVVLLLIKLSKKRSDSN